VITDTDIDLLEMLLDGELSCEQEQALRARLAEDAPLARALRELQQQRRLREEYYASLEADEAACSRVYDAVMRSVRRHDAAVRVRRALAVCAAAAACLAAGVFIAHISAGPRRAPDRVSVSQQVFYNVAITDENGSVIAVQQFDSLEKARRFSEDLARWQENQQRIRNGLVTVRATSF